MVPGSRRVTGLMRLPAEQVRVLGCLVEKEATTPQSYPLTLNALRLACNQSTNREPVMDLDDRQVEAALAALRERGLVRVVYSSSNRVPKYRHVLDEAWELDRAELAVLSVLSLRGPQTVGELKSRTERQHTFVDLAEVQSALDRLAVSRPEPLVVRLERRPGQKEVRYMVAFAEDADVRSGTAEPSGGPVVGLDELAAEVGRLRGDLDELRTAFEAFRASFE